MSRHEAVTPPTANSIRMKKRTPEVKTEHGFMYAPFCVIHFVIGVVNDSIAKGIERFAYTKRLETFLDR